MVLVSISGAMVEAMMDSGKIIKCMAKASIDGMVKLKSFFLF